MRNLTTGIVLAMTFSNVAYALDYRIPPTVLSNVKKASGQELTFPCLATANGVCFFGAYVISGVGEAAALVYYDVASASVDKKTARTIQSCSVGGNECVMQMTGKIEVKQGMMRVAKASIKPFCAELHQIADCDKKLQAAYLAFAKQHPAK